MQQVITLCLPYFITRLGLLDCTNLGTSIAVVLAHNAVAVQAWLPTWLLALPRSIMGP